MAVHHNRYELLERIGVGGMAEVFRARMVGPAGFQKVVALKRILEDFCADQDFLHRFVDEARLTARLQHPNICQVLDFGVINDRYYLTLEYVHGLDLAQVLGRLEYHGELLAPGLALQVIAGVLRGLAHAHRAVDEEGRPLGIVHRDVSPQNVLLSINGDIKLGDFGAAKADAAVRQARTQENIALGKLAYMAPEQRRGKTVDGRSDVYGVGVLLAESLEGPTLFRRNTGLGGIDREQLAELAGERFPTAAATRIAGLLGRALHPQRTKRFADATSMLAEVEQCAVDLGVRTSTDQLGDLVRRLMEDEEFLTGRHKRRKVPTPGAIVTTSFASDSSDAAIFSEDSADLESEDSLDETSVDPIDDAIDSKGIDSLEHMLDSANVAFANTQLAARASAALDASEDLATQVVKDMTASPQDMETLIIHGPQSDEYDQLGSNDVEVDDAEFDNIATKIIKGPQTPLPSPSKFSGNASMGNIGVPIDRATTGKQVADDSAAPATLPKLPGKDQRTVKPPPTLPTMPGLGLRAATTADKTPSQPPAGPPPSAPPPAPPHRPPMPDAQVAPGGVAPASQAKHRSEPPEPPEASRWNGRSSDESAGKSPAAGSMLISPEDEDDPTYVDQSPHSWNETSQAAAPSEEAAEESSAPKRNGPQLAVDTALVRRARARSRPRPRRRHTLRYIVIGLLLAIGVALWGAFAVIGWITERNRSLYPPEGTGPTDSNASTQPITPVVVPDAGQSTHSQPDSPAPVPSTEIQPSPDEQPATDQPTSQVDAGAEANREPSGHEAESPENSRRQASTTPDRASRLSERDGDNTPQKAAPRESPARTDRARLSILSEPPGRAYVDGGLVSSRTPVNRHAVSPGTHTVRVVFPRTGEAATRTVDVAAGEHEVVRFEAEH